MASYDLDITVRRTYTYRITNHGGGVDHHEVLKAIHAAASDLRSLGVIEPSADVPADRITIDGDGDNITVSFTADVPNSKDDVRPVAHWVPADIGTRKDVQQLIDTIQGVEVIDYQPTDHGPLAAKAAELINFYAGESARHANQLTQIHELMRNRGYLCTREAILAMLTEYLPASPHEVKKSEG